MSLRTLLIIIGVLIVIGVYAFSAYRRRREARIAFARRFSRLDIPDVILEHDGAEDEDGDFVVGEAYVPRLPEEVELPPDHAPDERPPERRLAEPTADRASDELPAVRNDSVQRPAASNARRQIDQMDLFGPADATARPRARTAAVAEPPPEPGSGLITLYVCARSGQQFTGPTLVRAFNGVGMQFGDMSIFHHYGAGDLKCQEPVFSAANMYEPGTFDLGKIEAFRTAGVALFMQLPGPLDGPVAFELLLNTAQRLTELAGGELFGEPDVPLDSSSIARLRKRSARFANARA